MNLKTLAKNELHLNLTEKESTDFELFKNELIEWNSRLNLTAIRTPEEIDKKHFLDSLTLLHLIPENTKTLADIGTGAGFPGIPLAIIRPDIQITLIESIGKKCKFLEHIKEILNLKNIEIVNARAEEVGKHIDYKNRFDIVTARAVTKIEELALLAIPLLKKEGVLLAQKGTLENIESEKENIKKHGGEIIDIKNLETESLKDRRVVILKKIR